MNNQFVYALGVGAFAWGLFAALDWFLDAFARFLTSFAVWYRYSASPYAWEMAAATAVVYLLISGFLSSRRF